MGLLFKILAIVLFIAFIVFVLFFGRLPALRRTPIGALNRLLALKLPELLRDLDQKLTHGRIYASVAETVRFVLNERHPTILIGFILLLAVAEYLFLPQVFPAQPFSTQIMMVVIVLAPYIFLYLSATVDPGFITPATHSYHMTLYPYDHTNFHPTVPCTTCKHFKPARSKHCSICKRCVSRADHHCIFINACVGYGNMHWFILLLFSTSILTFSGAYLGLNHTVRAIQQTYPYFTFLGTGWGWTDYAHFWIYGLNRFPHVAGVSLLCVLCTPLVVVLFGYNMYQIWAGVTTNESGKWDDTKLDIVDGWLFKRRIDKLGRRHSAVEPHVKWPVEPEWVVLSREKWPAEDEKELAGRGIGPWSKVESTRELVNIYDTGFFGNLKDIFRKRPKVKAAIS